MKLDIDSWGSDYRGGSGHLFYGVGMWCGGNIQGSICFVGEEGKEEEEAKTGH
jgi:hypothetical protein